MQYEKIVKGRFIDRPNRFIAHVEINGIVETVHVKNTGRCKELLIPGVTVILEDFRGRVGCKKRKTSFDLIAVYKNNKLLINIDSQAPNKVVAEWLSSQDYDLIKPEYSFGKSRVDFYMEKVGSVPISKQPKKFLLEVKGCTLEKNGVGYFPDAPTERGVKHLRELTLACTMGYECYIAFVIQIPGVSEVYANIETHREFGIALEEAKNAGVRILFLQCEVREDELIIVKMNVSGDRPQ